jgi:rhamnosyltransferase subunit B
MVRGPSATTATGKECSALNVLLVTLGSSGDVLPYIGLGRALSARGHDVTLLANSHFQQVIRECGLQFVELGTEADYQKITLDPSLWSPITGARLLASGLILSNMRRTFEIIESRNIPGQTVIAGPFTAFGARIAQERLGIPLVTVCLQPSALRSTRMPPVIKPLPLSQHFPAAWNKLCFSLADRAFFDRLVRGHTNALRTELGLSAVRGSFTDWSLSPARTIGLFPDWFAPEAFDWPKPVRLCEFPLYDASDQTPLSPEASEFLDAGAAPLVFTPGSAMRHASEFFAAAVEACRLLGARGVLVSPFRDHLPADLPPCILAHGWFPFSRLFPRTAAVVHHGGIGTTSLALKAAVPQLIMPMAFDQHDNARRLERLGVARSLSRHRFRGPAVARLLGELLGSRSVATACRTASERLQNEHPLGEACRWIEQAVSGAEV